MNEVFISKNVLFTLEQIFPEFSKSHLKGLLKQRGISVLRNGQKIVIERNDFTLYQDEIMKVGKKIFKLHSPFTFELISENEIKIRKA